jgi:hypothetical protein
MSGADGGDVTDNMLYAGEKVLLAWWANQMRRLVAGECVTGTEDAKDVASDVFVAMAAKMERPMS